MPVIYNANYAFRDAFANTRTTPKTATNVSTAVPDNDQLSTKGFLAIQAAKGQLLRNG
jgi:hypothetical protein